MRLHQIEFNHHHHERFLFHMKRYELNILASLLENTLSNTAHHPLTEQWRNRCRDMRRTVAKALTQSDDLNVT